MTGKTYFGSATLKSAQNFRPEKTFCRRCGELWEVFGLMVIALVSGYQEVWVQALAGGRHCCVLGHNTLLSQCLSLNPGVLIG